MSKVLCWAHVGGGVCAESFGAVEKPSFCGWILFAMATGKHLQKTSADTVINITYSPGAWNCRAWLMVAVLESAGSWMMSKSGVLKRFLNCRDAMWGTKHVHEHGDEASAKWLAQNVREYLWSQQILCTCFLGAQYWSRTWETIMT